MNQIKSQTSDLTAIAWGALFIWWGITELVPGLPQGIGALGIGLILLGLNLVRANRGETTSGFSTGLGILALALGAMELAGSTLNLPFELSIFAILLIVLGGYFLTREWFASRAA